MEQTPLKQIWNSLPITLQQYIRAGDWEKRLIENLSTYQLTAEQTEEIKEEVVLVLLGITARSDLALSIQTAAQLSAEQAEQLAREISEKIFEPVIDDLLDLDPVTVDDYSAIQELTPEIREALAKMPERLRAILASTDTMEHIQTIGKKYNLRIDQLGELDNNISRVLLGLKKPNDFGPDLQAGTSLEKDVVNAITQEVDEKIFKPILAQLKQAEPAPTTATPESIFAKRLGEPFRLPREEIDLGFKNDPYLEPTGES